MDNFREPIIIIFTLKLTGTYAHYFELYQEFCQKFLIS